MPDAKRQQREIEELIMAGYPAKDYTDKDLDLMRAGKELTAKDERIAELEAENEQLKDRLGGTDIEKSTLANLCGTCAHEWAGTCTFESAKDRPAPYGQTCRYVFSQWTRKGITR